LTTCVDSRQNHDVVKLRLVASLVFLLIAIGLPVAAVSSNGPPWGFRGHHAVVLDVAGTVEATASDARRQKEGRVDEKLEVAPNLHLDSGDELRVARLSHVRLRFASAVVGVGDGARVVIGDGKITLQRGLITVVTTAGQRPFEVALDSSVIVVRGGDKPANAAIVADGKGGARAIVEDGSLKARTASNHETLSEPGRLLILETDTARVGDRPTSVVLSATCQGTKLNIVAPPQAQLFVASSLTYADAVAGADSGSANVDVEGAEVVVFARDVVGNTARITTRCDKKK